MVLREPKICIKLELRDGVVTGIVRTWSNLIDDNVVSCRKNISRKRLAQIKLFCDSHCHSFGFGC